MLTICINILFSLGYSQERFVLSGNVSDEQNNPLPGASVYITPSCKGAMTNTTGNYSIGDIDIGRSVIEISFIGYKTFVDTVEISKNNIINVQLKLAALRLQEVVIADHYAENRKKEESLNIEVVNNSYLQQNLGGSLMSSLERLPGITTIDIGSGQSKPVIRGMGFNRVVVIENGIKHEGQQWGADHGLEIDQYAVNSIEVIKGPASLMYGSDAIGGVIDVKNNKISRNNTIEGEISLTGKTNNDFLGTSVSISGRKEWLFLSMRITLLDYGDYRVPADSVDIYSYRAALYKNRLRNTAGKEHNIHFIFGIIKKSFTSKFFASNVNSKSGFFANAHGLEPRNVNSELHDKSSRDILYPYQKVNHFKLINKSQWRWRKFRLKSDLGFQRNFRQEWSKYVSHGYMPAVFPDSLDFNADLERQFDKYIYSGNIKLTYLLNDKTKLSTGITANYQDNRIDGRGFIIPAFTQTDIGGFILAKHSLTEKSIVQFGLRCDYGNIVTQSYYDWFQSPAVHNTDTTMEYLLRANALNLIFSNISWSIGYNYNLENINFKVNAGKSFRMPIAKELAANGVNYHHFSYEVGNAGLSPEISYQLDAGIEYNLKKFAIGITPFLNYFANYIYLNPGSEHDRLYGNGNQVYYYTECKVFRYGGEIHVHYKIVKPLTLGLIGEYVYSKQLSGEKKGYTLPFSPPVSAIVSLRYQKQKLWFVKDVYVSADCRLTAPQNNIVPPEKTTDGYLVFNIGFGGGISLKEQILQISLQVRNVFNTKYFNHTSYYRLINLPEPGRNFVFNISIPFRGKLNKK